MPRRGLEPPRLAAHGPEPCASTNSAIWAAAPHLGCVEKAVNSSTSDFRGSRRRFVDASPFLRKRACRRGGSGAGRGPARRASADCAPAAGRGCARGEVIGFIDPILRVVAGGDREVGRPAQCAARWRAFTRSFERARASGRLPVHPVSQPSLDQASLQHLVRHLDHHGDVEQRCEFRTRAARRGGDSCLP